MQKNLPAPRKHFSKRTLSLVLACIAVLALTVPALACGGHGHHGGKRVQTQVTVCTVKGCETAGRHIHNGVTYCGYAHEDGVCDGKCLALCSAEDCDTIGRHTHDGVTYCGSCHEAGFCSGQCLTLCPVEGCTTVGRHTHDGTVYCGNHHEDGFCDGHCAAGYTYSQRSGHHGGGHH